MGDRRLALQVSARRQRDEWRRGGMFQGGGRQGEGGEKARQEGVDMVVGPAAIS